MFKWLFSLLRSGQGRAGGWFAFSYTGGSICCCQIDRSGSKPRILNYSTVPSNGLDSLALVEASKGFKLNHQHSTVVLGRDDYQVFMIEAPKVPDEEMKTAIRWRVKDMLGYPLDDATIDLVNIPADKYAPGRERSIYVFAARNEAVRQCAQAFDQAKIGLQVMEVAELAQRNISGLLEPEGAAVAFLNFTHEGGLLTFTYGGELHLTRSIEVTTTQLADAGDEKLQSLFGRIALELQRSLDYFDRHMHFLPLSKLVLAPMAKEEELQTFLREQLFVPVEMSSLEDILDFSAVPALKDRARQAEALVAIGAALRMEEKRQ